VCGRYTLSKPGDVLQELQIDFDVDSALLAPRFNVAPTQVMPIVRLDREGRREVAGARWGLIPFWAKDPSIGSSMINARSETIAEKPAFRNALKTRRCLIPSDGFYEWRKIGKVKQPYHIHLGDRRPMIFAGLWERWDKGPTPIESYTILTTSANRAVAELHERMPVILDAETRALWLDPQKTGPLELADLFRPFPAEDFALTPVSRLVNDARNEVANCLEPIVL
jgi:putative SOS response-associated peptidase YedK